MSSLLNSSNIAYITGQFQNLWKTLSTGRNSYITIVKEPIKIINQSNSLNVYGYSEDSLNQSDITYTPVTGTFPSVVLYNNAMNSKQFTELHFSLDENQIIVKLDKPGRDYMKDGKVEYVIVEDNKFNLVSSTERIQNYYGLKFYYFKLQATQ